MLFISNEDISERGEKKTQYIMALDSKTTNCRCILFNDRAEKTMNVIFAAEESSATGKTITVNQI